MKKLSGLCYLAAPYSSSDPALVERRMEQVGRAQAALINQGMLVVTPLSAHYIIQYEDLPGDWKFWREYGETLLSACQNLILLPLPGWEQSQGVSAELALARRLSIPCYQCGILDYDLKIIS
jgi:hypothetical protein